ncbi:Gag-like protein [Operophtera brumata]|uniref:Gag-like protein n=1 Tax=Operophtera brumata TaxID=104452 RepID=A0A0L7K473_OPEBR|nr:Gag-like protein [Operophtera brumata]
MELDMIPTESSSSSSSDDGFTVAGNKRKKKAASKKVRPAKVTVAPATRPPPPASSPPPAVPIVTGEKKEKAPPPLFLREKEKWSNVSSLLREKNIPYTSARSTKDGIKIHLQSSADHRKMTTLLRSESIGFHTYALEDERLLRVVIRGLPAEHDTNSIKADLIAQNFPVREVHRILYSYFTMVIVVKFKSVPE